MASLDGTITHIHKIDDEQLDRLSDLVERLERAVERLQNERSPVKVTIDKTVTDEEFCEAVKRAIDSIIRR